MSESLQPHQQRVVDEQRELNERLAKLVYFFTTPVFASLPAGEQERLRRQCKHMAAYDAVLLERIAAFGA